MRRSGRIFLPVFYFLTIVVNVLTSDNELYCSYHIQYYNTGTYYVDDFNVCYSTMYVRLSRIHVYIAASMRGLRLLFYFAVFIVF